MPEILRQQLLDTSRGRILSLLRTGGMTADDIASKLGVTRAAVRAQLSAMDRDGVVRRVGKRQGITRPSHVYELTPEIEQVLSKAYFPLLTQMVAVSADILPSPQLEALLRRVGKELAHQLRFARRISGSPKTRAIRASDVMNAQLGALTHVDGNGKIVIRGTGCPLAALTGKHPRVCLVLESLVSEIVRLPVHECCDREERPRCCFEIGKVSRKR